MLISTAVVPEGRDWIRSVFSGSKFPAKLVPSNDILTVTIVSKDLIPFGNVEVTDRALYSVSVGEARVCDLLNEVNGERDVSGAATKKHVVTGTEWRRVCLFCLVSVPLLLSQ